MSGIRSGECIGHKRSTVIFLGIRLLTGECTYSGSTATMMMMKKVGRRAIAVT